VPTPIPLPEMALHSVTKRVRCSRTFDGCALLKSLLDYIVTSTIKANPPTATQLGLALWAGRNINSDVAIRMQVKNLRRKLEAYYASAEASQDPIRIEVPEGKYKATWAFSPSCLVDVEQFSHTLYRLYRLPIEISTRWYTQGLDQASQVTIANLLRDPRL
jgi:hypothetical protein